MRSLLSFLSSLIKLFKELAAVKNAMQEDLQALKKLDPSFEVSYQFLFHAGFQALKLYRLSHAFYVANFKFIAYFIYQLNRILYAVDIHPAAYLEPGVVIDHGTGLVIGSTSFVGSGTVLYHGVTLGAKYITTGKRHPTVGKNVVLGAGAKVLGPITVGDGAKIGANSVVLIDVPEKATVVGIPAKMIRKIATNPSNELFSQDRKFYNNHISEVGDDLCLKESKDSSMLKEVV
ncbi:serine O-acetyltransferase EpsC [Fervidobacterium sp.]